MGVSLVLLGLGLCFFLLGGALGVGQDVRRDLVWRLEGLSLKYRFTGYIYNL